MPLRDFITVNLFRENSEYVNHLSSIELFWCEAVKSHISRGSGIFGEPFSVTSSILYCSPDTVVFIIKRILRLPVAGIVPVGDISFQDAVPVPVNRV